VGEWCFHQEKCRCSQWPCQSTPKTNTAPYLRLQPHLALLLMQPSPVTIKANTAARITPRFEVVTEVSIR